MMRMAKQSRHRQEITTLASSINMNRFWVTTVAAAAVSSLQPQCLSVRAFPVQPPPQHSRFHLTSGLQHLRNQEKLYSTSTSRLFQARSNNNDDESGVFGTLKKVAKTVLPKKWFQSEEERRAEIERKRVKDEITGGLSEVLKGAPLPVRMIGSLMGPLLGNAMSSLAQAAQEQQATVSQVLSQATTCMQSDPAVAQALGSVIQVSSTPFSQSSSTTSINGRSTTRIQLSVQVSGDRDTGVATITASEQGLQAIQLQTNRSGRISVSTAATSTSSYASSSRFARQDDDNIIEAEIIEKNVDNRKK